MQAREVMKGALMPLIPDQVIDDIQTRADIVELIGRYVPLKRAGRHYKALCPFHKEKTPSFTVNTDKQIYHCFGCGTGGNIFGFLMQHDRVTFPEAVRQVAEQVGISLPSPQAGARHEQFERLAGVMDQVCRYYERTLAHPQAGRQGRDYLATRGVGATTQAAFRVGFAPSGWDRLLKATQARQISRELLEQAGLLVRGTRGAYDRFRNRLIFPILDIRRRVVGFGGRSLDGQEPKYLNSPETPLYQKGRHLFGLAQAKDAIIACQQVIVVEGYFDCLVLAEAGVTHVVSPLGTALTEEQARLLKRYAPRVILAFDADAAGESATLRGIEVLMEAGLDVTIAQLPSHVDPDEYLRHVGRERFEQRLGASASIVEFLLDCATKRFSLQHIEGRVQAAQFILPTMAKVPNAMLRREYIRVVADRLQLDEPAVLQELSKLSSRAPSVRLAAGVAPALVPEGAERLLVGLVLEEPSRWFQLKDDGVAEQVSHPSLRRILDAVSELSRAGAATTAQVISRVTAEGHGSLATALVGDAQAILSKDEAFRDCVRRIHRQHRTRRAAQLQEHIRDAQASGADEIITQLLTELQDVVKGGTR
jgi:DNA primase